MRQMLTKKKHGDTPKRQRETKLRHTKTKHL